MKVPVVRLKIRVRLPDGSRPYLDPVFAGNKKLKPLYALVDGQPQERHEGSYFLRYLKKGKRVWQSVGTDATVAQAKFTKKQKELDAIAHDVEVVVEESATRTPLLPALAEYLSDTEAAKSPKTYAAYAHSLNIFRDVLASRLLEAKGQEITEEATRQAAAEVMLEAITRRDMLSFIARLRADGNCSRTVANRVAYVKSFLISQKIKNPLEKRDKVRYVKKEASAYSSNELNALFAAADREETELFQFFLCTGARDGEVQHAAWPDLDLDRNAFFVKEKADLEFSPKDLEEGRVPLPDQFVELMRVRKARSKSRLIFAREDGKPDGHFLRILQRLAFRAGLNCGNCFDKKGRCCSERASCSRWGLHRFRKTFATMHHEQGVSARTIQRWLRHSDIQTTLLYLAGSDDESEKTRGQVNASFAPVSRFADK